MIANAELPKSWPATWRIASVAFVLVVGESGLPATAHAQAREASVAGASSNVLEEVVVSAEKRSETLQTVPVAVSVFSEEALRNQRLFDLKSVSELTPGLFVGEIKPSQAQLYIRGICSGDDGAAAD